MGRKGHSFFGLKEQASIFGRHFRMCPFGVWFFRMPVLNEQACAEHTARHLTDKYFYGVEDLPLQQLERFK